MLRTQLSSVRKGSATSGLMRAPRPVKKWRACSRDAVRKSRPPAYTCQQSALIYQGFWGKSDFRSPQLLRHRWRRDQNVRVHQNPIPASADVDLNGRDFSCSQNNWMRIKAQLSALKLPFLLGTRQKVGQSVFNRSATSLSTRI